MADKRRSFRERLGSFLSVLTPRRRRLSGRLSRFRDAKYIKPVTKFDELYEIGEEVMPCGHDHMKVNFATRKSDGMEVAIKRRFKPLCFSTKADELAWRKGSEYLLNLPDSDNVAKVYEILEDSSAFYVVMEKVRGLDLFELIGQEHMPLDTARSIIHQILCALAHMHSHSAVHKDIKLENIMVDAPNALTPKSSRDTLGSVAPRSPTQSVRDRCSMSGYYSESTMSSSSVKVVDFDTVDEWIPFSPLPRDVLGTDQYIAPEAYAGKYSPQSDIFAVGVIAYKLITNKFPFNPKLFDDKPGENWVGSPKMQEIQGKLQIFEVDYCDDIFIENPLARDLIRVMLSRVSSLRPTAFAALQHPWFKDMVFAGTPPSSRPSGASISSKGSTGGIQYQADDSEEEMPTLLHSSRILSLDSLRKNVPPVIENATGALREVQKHLRGFV